MALRQCRLALLLLSCLTVIDGVTVTLARREPEGCSTRMIHFIFKEHNQRTASIIVFLGSSIWGMLWIPMRLTEAMGVPPIWVHFWFVAMPALPLGYFCLNAIKSERQNWAIYLAAGMCVGTAFTLYSLGLLLASVSKTTTLFYLTPIWSTLLGSVLLGERAGLRRWGAIGLALVGCCFVMQVNPVSMQFEKLDLLGFLSGIFWAVGIVILGRYPNVDFKIATLSQYLCGTVITVFAIAVLGVAPPDTLTSSKAALMGLFFSGLILMPSFLVIIRVTQYMSPGLVGILMLSEVLVAVITAMVLLGEVLTNMQWIGVGVILGAGVIVATADESRGRAAVPPTDLA
jgi:drug/metabolite transporter (DMT)-like permease